MLQMAVNNETSGDARRGKSPIAYPGGKWFMVKHILPLLPPHRTYVEVFGGAAHVLFAKDRAPLEVYNDIDGELVNLFRVIRDEEKSRRLERLAYWTLVSREEWQDAKNTLLEEQDDVLRAWKFAVVLLQSYQMRRTAWATRKSKACYNSPTSPFEAFWHKIAVARERLRYTQIEHSDFRELIPRYDSQQTLFFCDPPYHPETCSHFYAVGMTREDHADLIRLMLGAQGMVVLCGRRCADYTVLEDNGWTSFDFEVPNRNPAGCRERTRIETVWLNPRAWNMLQQGKGGGLLIAN